MRMLQLDLLAFRKTVDEGLADVLQELASRVVVGAGPVSSAASRRPGLHQ